jgi:hypothetical protein
MASDARTTERPRYRPHQWINIDTFKPIYSIQASVGHNGWMHVSKGGKPLFFDTAEARDAALREFTT